MRRRNVILLVLFALLGSCVGSCGMLGNSIATIALVNYYLTYEAPNEYTKNVHLDRKGLLIDGAFTPTKDSIYYLTLRMIHKKGEGDEYNHLFLNDKLPVDIEIKIDRLNDFGAAPVFHVIRKPDVYARGLDITDLELGSVSLSEAGRYRIRLTNRTDLPDLRGITVRFRVAGGRGAK